MNLHEQIMNIACDVCSNENAMAGTDAYLAYKEGHRDACHAAAELALKADAEIERLRDQLSMIHDWASLAADSGDVLGQRIKKAAAVALDA